MKTTPSDRQLIWKALASYINECVLLLETEEEQQLADYYKQQIEDSHNLRNRLKVVSLTD